MSTEMQINPQRAKQLAENLVSVVQRVQAASKKNTNRSIRIVAVSKLKPATDILALHSHNHNHNQHHSNGHGHIHFGENYVQELQAKAKLLPRTIRWHFIGALQTNKCKSLAEGVPNLWCVESVDTAKKADALEKGRAAVAAAAENEAGGDGGGVEGGEVGQEPLRVMVQVNTSGETEKSGCEPQEATELCRHVKDSCPHLLLQGLMTIGAIARSVASTPETENEDFVSLRETRDAVCAALGLEQSELELSMGMSADFESAIAMGSDEVRIGSTIFGERPPKKDAKVLEDQAGGSG